MAELISIVTPYLDIALFAKDYVASIKNQSYQNWECILINDSGNPQLEDLLKSLIGQDSRFIHLSTSKAMCGPGDARSLGIEKARGDVICFCDIDDIWHPEKLHLQYAFHRRERLDISVTAFAKFIHITSNKGITIKAPSHQLSYSDLLHGNSIPLLTTMVRKELVQGLSKSGRHEDYLMWLKLFKNNNLRYKSLPKVLAFYRLHKTSLTSNKIKSTLWTFEIIRKESSSPPQSIMRVVFWMLSTTKRLIRSSTEKNVKMSVDDLLAKTPCQI